MFTNSTPTDKALALEYKGDQYREKNKIKKAFECYQQALELNDQRIELYDKLLALHEELKDKWTEEDFSNNLHWSMKKQELQNPDLKRIHSRSTPEYKEVAALIKKLMRAETEESITSCVEDIASYGDLAIYPLLDSLLKAKDLKEVLTIRKPK